METLPPVTRVVLTGSESTGKTTLAQELALHFGAVWTPEYAREYAAGRGEPLAAADVEPIARGQAAAERRGIDSGMPLVIHDTDLLSTAVYASHYYGHCPAWIEQLVERRMADLYLLMDIDCQWIPDAQRDRGGRRDEVHELFREALDRVGARYLVIGGTWEERRIRATAAIEALLRGRLSP